jgi:hypothetical protein
MPPFGVRNFSFCVHLTAKYLIMIEGIAWKGKEGNTDHIHSCVRLFHSACGTCLPVGAEL